MTIQFPKVGERFLDRYQITSVLGAGGMSRVYGAIQEGLDRHVAIKLLAPAGADNLSSSQFDNVALRFEREAKLISSFRSSHTVSMYDYGRSGEHLYMILEHVDGMNLHELVHETGPLPPERVARIMRQALSSLAEAHEMGILHRDIKPQNIMVYEHLGDPDCAKVLDFGIAKAIGETGKNAQKLTEERTIIGTPSYMSPEQILGHQLTAASDIYSLGLVAYELLFGIVAVEADSAVSTMARHLAPAPIEIPDDRQMPADFLAILRKMISKELTQRYQNAGEVLADLALWDGGDKYLTVPRITAPGVAAVDTLTGTPPTTQPTEPAPESTRPLLVTSAVLSIAIMVAVGVVVALVWMMGNRTPEADALAEPTAPAVVPAVVDEIVVAPLEPETEVAAPEPEPVNAETEVAEATPQVAEESDPRPPSQPKKAVAKKSAAKKTVARSDEEDAVEPPEPLVVEPPPQPEPAPEPAATAAAEPKPAPTVVEAKPKPKAVAKKADGKAAKKKKKKKKKAVPLSF